MIWTVEELIEAAKGCLINGSASAQVGSISIDSRTLSEAQVYIAIQGKRFDGHAFVEDALHRKASCLIVSQEPHLTNGFSAVPTILVNDTTEALASIARFHRRRLGLPIVAVTGSCGKTTTKDLIAHLLSHSKRVFKSPGSQNNHIGVPMALLQLTNDHEVAVIELGSNHHGEIAHLASIVEPNIALITNVGPAHLEFFGSISEVLREKLSLLSALPPDGSAILPGDQLDVCLEAVSRLHPSVRVVTFGTSERCDIQGTDIQRRDQAMAVRLRDQMGQWLVPLVGYHNVENALAAIACSWALGVPLSDTKDRLSSFPPIPLRSEVIQHKGITILNDCYNANPLSFARALETLRDLKVNRRIAVVGDMMELGDYTESSHQAIGQLAAQYEIDVIIAFGEYADHVADGVSQVRKDSVMLCRTNKQLRELLAATIREGDGILIKGSRSLRLEDITHWLVDSFNPKPSQISV